MLTSATALTTLIRSDLVRHEGVSKLVPCRRFTSIFDDGAPADALYFIESGLVKLFKRDSEGKEIILRLAAPGDLFGEEALREQGTRAAAAEVLQEGEIYVIPREVFGLFAAAHPEVWQMLTGLLEQRERELEKKVELLCLKDVEHRILYYVGEVARTLGRAEGQDQYSVPLSQSELASLIGATRETTSTTLNALARRGLIRLGRRQLTLPSLDLVSSAESAVNSVHAAAQA